MAQKTVTLTGTAPARPTPARISQFWRSHADVASGAAVVTGRAGVVPGVLLLHSGTRRPCVRLKTSTSISAFTPRLSVSQMPGGTSNAGPGAAGRAARSEALK